MIREEALEELKEIRFNLNYKVNGTSRFDEALDIAIKTLEQEPCDDCISRKAALDDAGLAEFHRYDDYVKMRNYLKSLPSVTPRPKIENAPLSMIKSIREKEGK